MQLIDGKCQDIDECNSTKPLTPCDQICENIFGSYKCSCQKGFSLVNGSRCEDIDECNSTKPLTLCDQICENILGSYKCSCQKGFNLVNGSRCEAVNVYPYGEHQSDQEFGVDDLFGYYGSIMCLEIKVQPYGLRFFGERHYKLHICRNGKIQTNSEWSLQWPRKFGVSFFLDRIGMFAPFWARSDQYQSFKSGISKVYYHIYDKSQSNNDQTSKILALASKHVKQYGGERFAGFTATWVLVVTWENLCPSVIYYSYLYDGTSGMCPMKNTFQAVIITDWYNSFLMYNYPRGGIQWAVGVPFSYYKYWTNLYGLPVAGWNEPESRIKQNIKGSGTILGMYNLDKKMGNTDLLGRYFWRIESSNEKGAFEKCFSWVNYQIETNFIFWYHWRIRWDTRMACPCTIWQAFLDRGRFYWDWYFSWPELCFRSRRFFYFSYHGFGSQLCCYSTEWEDFGALKIGPPEGGHISVARYNTYYGKTEVPTDTEAYKFCCVEGFFCDLFYQYRPSDTCQFYRPPPRPWFWGDPHIRTLDGGNYTFNGLGEYVMLDAQSGTFQLQARTGMASGNSTTGTVFVAGAAKEENTTTVEVRIAKNGGLHILFGGILYSNFSSLTNQSIETAGNLSISKSEDDCLEVSFPSTTSVIFCARKEMLSFVVSPGDDYKNSTKGLLGTWNANTSDDFTLPDGTVLSPSSTAREIHFGFGVKWQINQSQSLFTYAQNETASTFAIPDFLPMFGDNITWQNDTIRKQAEDVCGSDNECLFDVASTNDLALGQATKDIGTKLTKESKSLDNFPPKILNVPSSINVTLKETFMINITAEDSDTVTFQVVNKPDSAIVNQSGNVLRFMWPVSSSRKLNLSFVATDDQGAAATWNPTINMCACEHRGQCVPPEDGDPVNTDSKFVYMGCVCQGGYTGRFCDSEIDACEVNGQPCYEDVVCTDLPPPADETGYKCGPCPSGFTGNGAECSDFDECQSNQTNSCSQLCINAPGSYSCACQNGYSLNDDKESCDDINECVPTSDCMQRCLNTPGSYNCSCDESFERDPTDWRKCRATNPCEGGHNCSQVCYTANYTATCACFANYELQSDGKTCLDIDECNSTNNLTLCDQICENIPGSYNCSCKKGFDLINNRRCEDINECIDEDYFNCTDASQHCVNTPGSYKCECEKGLQLIDGKCQDIDECNSTNPLRRCDHICENILGSYRCSCPNGFSLVNGSRCEDIDECNSTIPLHRCDQICENTFGNYNCSCQKGFNLINNRRCEDINECIDEEYFNCTDPLQHCVNTPGSYKCECEKGLQLIDEKCQDIDECNSTKPLHRCDQICENIFGSYNCSCQNGFNLVNDYRCEDIDECFSTNPLHRCDQICENTYGNYNCSCREGFNLVNGSRCEDIDECNSTKPLTPCDQICENIIGSYNCSCQNGFHLVNGYRCEDIDECNSTKPLTPCDQICENIIGSYNCSCKKGFNLVNGSRCEVGNLYPYGEHQSDQEFGVDDLFGYYGSIMCLKIKVQPYGLRFFGERHYKLHICRNGIIQTKNKWSVQWPRKFGISYYVDTIGMFAPFWARSDQYQSFKSGISKVYYHIYDKSQSDHDQTSKILALASKHVEQYGGERFASFTATWVLVVTWENLCPSVVYRYLYDGNPEMCPMKNTFQAVIITDWYNSFLMYNYPRGGIQWAVGVPFSYYKYWTNLYGLPVAGWNEPESGRKLNVKGSGTILGMYNLDKKMGNTDLLGRHFWRIESSDGKGAFEKCFSWVNSQIETNFMFWYYWSIRWDTRMACPCTMWQAFLDRGRFYWDWQFTWPEVCFRSRRFVYFSYQGLASQLCCYSTEWEDYGALKIGPPEGGHISVTRYNTYYGKTEVPTDTEAYKFCCVEGFFCDLFYQYRPSDTCQFYRPPPRPWFWGDPHIRTLDGGNYTFNGLGEYVMLDAESGTFQLQARTGLAQGNSTTGTVFVAGAAKEENTTTVEVRINKDGGLHILFGGTPYSNFSSLTNQSIEIAGNLSISKSEKNCLEVSFPSTTSVIFCTRKDMLSFVVSPGDDYKNSTKGLLGTWNDNASDDFTLPDGTVLPPSSTAREIHFEFGVKWQINQSQSLFTYAQNENTSNYAIPDFLPMFGDNITWQNDTIRKKAEEVCVSDQACLFDAASTNDLSVGQATKDIGNQLSKELETLDNFPPKIHNVPSSINVTLGKTFMINITAQDSDTVAFRVVNKPDSAIINQSENVLRFMWPVTSSRQLNLSFVATDDQGAAATWNPSINMCACEHKGHCVPPEDGDPVNTNSKFVYMGCACQGGYTGRFCDSEIDACEVNGQPCYEDVVCTDLPPPANETGYTCGPCPSGFTGNGAECSDFDECQSNQTNSCSQLCINAPGSYSCACQNGYSLNDDKESCDDINECVPTSDCMQHCLNTEGSYNCSCDESFERDPTDWRKCTAKYPCNPDLQVNCSHVCYTDKNKTAKCACFANYELQSDGKTCLDIDECNSTKNLTRCDQICLNIDGSYNCSCRKGFNLINNYLCEDINECIDEDYFNCTDPLQRCVNTPGSYKCECEKGLQLIDGKCQDIDECNSAKPLTPCDQICENILGSYKCSCQNGFKLVNGSRCEDIDECNSINPLHRCDQICENIYGSFKCSCQKGFSLVNGSRCEDIDECNSINPLHRCDQICENIYGSFKCSCQEGFNLVNGSHCEEKNETVIAPELPTPRAPSEQEREEAVKITVLANSTSFKWDFHTDKNFKEKLASVVSSFCSVNRTKCAIRETSRERRAHPNHLYTAKQVHLLPGYPSNASGSLQIAVYVQQPLEMSLANVPALPSNTLLTIILLHKSELGASIGAIILGAEVLYKPTTSPTTSPQTIDIGLIVIGACAAAVVILVIIILIICIKRRRNYRKQKLASLQSYTNQGEDIGEDIAEILDLFYNTSFITHGEDGGDE
ncbi:fibrillin-2-like isoform X3 [Acropora muricata]|uniref:fibrillin-2-like isoform X3 n=1 Tax=Acropora muricata TaxID=159855 RepID=UPI0034E4130A